MKRKPKCAKPAKIEYGRCSSDRRVRRDWIDRGRFTPNEKGMEHLIELRLCKRPPIWDDDLECFVAAPSPPAKKPLQILPPAKVINLARYRKRNSKKNGSAPR